MIRTLIMPRNTSLSEVEKGKILALSAEGYSKAEIAEKISRSRKVIYNFLSNPENYGKLKSSGPNKKLTPREERKLIEKASNSTVSCRQLAEIVDNKVSKMTVWRVLKRSSNIVRQKLKKAPRLLQRHKEARLQFCKKNLRTVWQQVIFSDEKKWNLDGPDGFNSYWRDLNKEPKIFSKRNFGGGSLMTWGAFHSSGLLELQVVSSRMKSSDYITILQCSLLPFLDQNAEQTFVFQHDNAPVHSSKETSNWLRASNINVMEWPACSPDLNPIENIWGILARRVYSNNKQYNSINELKHAIFTHWNNLEPTILQNLINSMENRLFNVIQNKGGHFK